MKKIATYFLLPVTLLAATSYGHTVAYPHGHPHAATLTWADVLITGGVIGVLALGAVALLRLRNQQGAVRQKTR